MPLQLREASPVIEVWTGGQDAGHTGWVDPGAADFKKHPRIVNASCGVGESPFCVLRLSPAGQFPRSGCASSGLVIVNEGSTAQDTFSLKSLPPDLKACIVDRTSPQSR